MILPATLFFLPIWRYSMKTLRKNDQGNDVKKWQLFLIGQGHLRGAADGIFGEATEKASKAFQKKHQLSADGIVGNKTIGIAMSLGFDVVKYPSDDPILQPDFPPRPAFRALSTEQRHALFGTIQYKAAPTKQNPEAIIITNNWDKEHIVRVVVPQLIGITGAPASGKIPFHKDAVPQLLALWAAWEKAGLLPLVKTYAGSWNPRFARGSTTSLSAHAWGTAFDINVAWNGLGIIPPFIGKNGSVRELVPLANQYGFYWGGHFKSRPDGMHFEIAKII